MKPEITYIISLLFLSLEEYIDIQEKIVMDRIIQTNKITTGPFYDI
ncbi:MAG: hypothetical protein ACJ72S_14295 [Nitrososphaeraceae archaeon]